MCLAMPGRLVERYDAQGVAMGRLDFGGSQREVCLEYLPELQIGQYAIVHVGFAISLLDEQAALDTLAELARLGLLEEGTDG